MPFKRKSRVVAVPPNERPFYSVNFTKKTLEPMVMPIDNNCLIKITNFGNDFPFVDTVIASDRWVLDGNIDIFSILVIYMSGVSYYFQVLPTDRPGIGIFSLVMANMANPQLGSVSKMKVVIRPFK